MVGFQQLQPSHIDIQVHLLFDERIAGTEGLDLGITEGRFVDVLGSADGGFTGHDLTDEFLFTFHQLKEVGIEGVFCHIGINLNLPVFVALPDNAAFPLLKVSRSPGTIEVVQGNQFLL